MMSLYALVLGFLLDLLFGDPAGFPHIVVGMGRIIRLLERVLRRAFPETERGELLGGAVLAVLLPIVTGAAAWGFLLLCGMVSPYLRLAVESVVCWQCLALRALGNAGDSVYRELEKGDVPAARKAVSMYVGRDTGRLDADGVTRACVETIAENAGDGVIAPMLFMAVGGGPLGVFYKAINTMDSMVGYKNDRYLFFGRAAAKLDDAANFIPARLAGFFMVLAAGLTGGDMAASMCIFLRDRKNHKSPNSAHTEAACAGALHIRLGGDAYYFGVLTHKPTIGDDDRPIEAADIPRAKTMLYAASILFFFVCIIIRGVILWL